MNWSFLQWLEYFLSDPHCGNKVNSLAKIWCKPDGEPGEFICASYQLLNFYNSILFIIKLIHNSWFANHE
jgi:hypothetical protein